MYKHKFITKEQYQQVESENGKFLKRSCRVLRIHRALCYNRNMQKTKMFLMFTGEACGKAEEALKRYTSLIPNSEIKSIERWNEGDPVGVAGQVKTALFTLAGTEYMASENTANHKFSFTPAISIFIECDSEDEIRRIHKEISKDGVEHMPLDNHGFSKLFAWVEDRYGVSWQLNLEDTLPSHKISK